MPELRYGSLFSGYLGLDMGVQSVLGGTTAWVSDIDKGACKILAHRAPDVPNLGDITTVDWSQVEPVDVLTGGSPCQDLSHAGKRQGMTEGTRSNLWVAMREAIAVLKPSLVVWENVRGAGTAEADSDVEHCAGCMGDPRLKGPSLRALGRVLGDLSDLGYVGQLRGLPASDIGACHGRFRYFIAAHPEGDTGWFHDGDDGAAPHPYQPIGEAQRRRQGTGHAGRRESVGSGNTLLPTPSARDWKDHTIRREPHRPDDIDTLSRALVGLPAATPTRGLRRHRDCCPAYEQSWVTPEGVDYGPAVRRWHDLTRCTPIPTEAGGKRGRRLSPRFSEWLMGLPAGWVTDVPGITRNEALKALGNGVVPAQAAVAVRHMLTMMEAVA